jgi:hypothetical protein
MMTREFAFVLATAVAIAAVPQIAHASCSGNACSAFSFVMFTRAGPAAMSLSLYTLIPARANQRPNGRRWGPM